LTRVVVDAVVVQRSHRIVQLVKFCGFCPEEFLLGIVIRDSDYAVMFHFVGVLMFVVWLLSSDFLKCHGTTLQLSLDPLEIVVVIEAAALWQQQRPTSWNRPL
jgi:hypothetical protein